MKNGFPFHAYRSTAAWRLLPLLLAVLVMALIAGGCSDEENTDVTQTPFPEPELQPWLLDVWGTGPDDVYVVGQPNVLLHWNGSAWTLVDGIGPDVLTAVWGTGTGTVYAVGHGGAILRGSGTSFTGMASGTEENLYDVGAGPYDAIYAVGEKGAIRRLSGNTWVSTQQLAYRYSDQDVALDTLVLNEDIQSLTTVNPYGLAGDHASVLMENDIPAYDHEWLWGAISDTTGADSSICSINSAAASGANSPSRSAAVSGSISSSTSTSVSTSRCCATSRISSSCICAKTCANSGASRRSTISAWGVSSNSVMISALSAGCSPRR